MYLSSQTESQGGPTSEKPWLLLANSEGAFPDFLKGDTQATRILSAHYKILDIKSDTAVCLRLSRVWPGLGACDFVIVEAGGVYSLSEFHDENEFLQFLSAPRKFGVYCSCSALYSYLKEEESDLMNNHTINAPLISQQCDHLDRKSESDTSETCTLLIKLFDGDGVKANFNSKDSLKDVKRWLQSELRLSLITDDVTIISKYTRIGHFEPSRFAFFYPGTRNTFSEAEEYLRLEDLKLCPRSVLVLHPDYDEILLNAARDAETRSIFKNMTYLTNFFQALYSFFDYGVEEATRDFQYQQESKEDDCSLPPRYLGTIGSVPSSTSLLEVSQSNISTQEDFESDSLLQASSENLSRLGREAF